MFRSYCAMSGEHPLQLQGPRRSRRPEASADLVSCKRLFDGPDRANVTFEVFSEDYSQKWNRVQVKMRTAAWTATAMEGVTRLPLPVSRTA